MFRSKFSTPTTHTEASANLRAANRDKAQALIAGDDTAAKAADREINHQLHNHRRITDRTGR